MRWHQTARRRSARMTPRSTNRLHQHRQRFDARLARCRAAGLSSARIAPSIPRRSAITVRPDSSTACSAARACSGRGPRPRRRRGLHHHHRDGVGDHVVELLSDPGSFLGHGTGRLGIPRPLQRDRPRQQRLGVALTQAQREPRKPRAQRDRRRHAELQHVRDQRPLRGVGRCRPDGIRRHRDRDQHRGDKRERRPAQCYGACHRTSGNTGTNSSRR